MLISERWISLRQVFEELEEFISHKEPSGDLFEQVSETRKLTWDFCDRASGVRVYNTDGTTTKVPKSIVEPPSCVVRRSGQAPKVLDERSVASQNDHVNLRDGRLGSGRKFEEIVTHSDGSQTHHEYGPYFGKPIVFARKEFVAFLLKVKHGDELVPHKSIAKIAAAIVQAYDDGKLTSRKWAEENIAPSATAGLFDTAWRTAAEERPEISRSGRRPCKKTQGQDS